VPHPTLPHAHPTAQISAESQFPADVKIGPFAVIEGPVTAGPGCVIGPHTHLIGPLTLGANNHVGTGAVIGTAPQHLGYKGEPSAVQIGDGNVFREHVTVHRAMPVGTGPGTGVTRIGHRGYFMAASHIAHDCVVGDDVIFANAALIGGHVTVGDRAFLGGNAAVHQFCRVGRLAFIGGGSASSKDVPPFWVIQNINDVRGLNLVGMKRANMSAVDRAAVRKAFRIIYMTRPALPLPAALLRIEAEVGTAPAVQELIEFIRTSKRGISGAQRLLAGADDDGSAEAA
jgi:UDP-N-acetylglucosamine acyltransferase